MSFQFGFEMPKIPLELAERRKTNRGKYVRRGKLIVVEGIDGSGKSTQIKLLHKWLEAKGQRVVFTEWNSSSLVKETTKRGKKKNLLTPTTFSLLHATDFADRLTYKIIPYLKAGMTVLADRYIYTAFARDVARGVDPQWVRDLYAFATQPDLIVYFRVPIQIAVTRILSARMKIKFHEAGMDLGLHPDPVESFKLFQGKVLKKYDEMTDEFKFCVIDAVKSIDLQQKQFRDAVSKLYDNKGMRELDHAENA
jgi:dTMP kinase